MAKCNNLKKQIQLKSLVNRDPHCLLSVYERINSTLLNEVVSLWTAKDIYLPMATVRAQTVLIHNYLCCAVNLMCIFLL